MFKLNECTECAEQTGGELSEIKEFDPLFGLDLPKEFDEEVAQASASEIPFEEQAAQEKEIAELNEKEGFEKLIEGVNPRYDPDVYNEYSTNCGACALGTWLRINEVYPGAHTTTGENIGTLSEMEDITGLHIKETDVFDIERSANSVGASRNAICAMTWPSGMSGHWVNLATGRSGELYVLDSQCGEVTEFSDYVKENPARNYYITEWRGKC